MKIIAKSAKARGEEMIVTEGGRHTKVQVGTKATVVPRHNEINERTAESILGQIGVER